MKSNKLIIILLSTLVIIASLILCYLLLRDYIPRKKVKIPEDEELQITLLQDIYKDFLSNQNLDAGTISLDESAMINLVTKKKFSDKNIEKLTLITSTYTGESTKYILSSIYNNGKLKLKLSEYVDPIYSHCTYECISEYKLDFKNSTLSYTSNGASTTLFSFNVPLEN